MERGAGLVETVILVSFLAARGAAALILARAALQLPEWLVRLAALELRAAARVWVRKFRGRPLAVRIFLRRWATAQLR